MEVSQNTFSRKKPDQLVYLELGSGNGGMLLSVSEDGFRFRAVSPLRPDGLVPFAFSFDGKVRLQGVGEVEWLDDDGKSGGMRFAEVSSEFRANLEKWLAVDVHRGRSGREVTPAAATPLDTMEKIREDLRRGYRQAPAARPEPLAKKAPAHSQAPLPNAPPAEVNGGSRERSPLNAAEATIDKDAEGAERKEARRTPEPEQRAKDSADLPASAADRHAKLQTTSHTSASAGQSGPTHRNNRPNRTDPLVTDRPSSRPGAERPKPFSPPPFTRPAEPESAASAEPLASAFLNKPAPLSPASATPSVDAAVSEPAQNADAPSALGDLRDAAPSLPEPPSREQAHASSESLRKPFRGESLSGNTERNSERPYIPPVEESYDPYEPAWERAKLNAPPESRHLSRAAAGSIIGIALAVILGALAFNFRQDIGQLVIAAGERISGENHSAAPVSSLPAAENKTDAQPAATSNPSETPAAANKTDTGASQPSTAPSANAAGDPSEKHGANPASQHDSPARDTKSAGRDTSSAMPRNNTADAATPSAPLNGNGNSATATPAPQVPAGSLVATIGTESGSGVEEFNAAREMLKGDHRHRDLSSAVNLLWAGVRKGYVPAEVTLADLYRRGDGVEKNCDQAQVLLVAASKKGSPEARQMLEQMAEQGCSE